MCHFSVIRHREVSNEELVHFQQRTLMTIQKKALYFQSTHGHAKLSIMTWDRVRHFNRFLVVSTDALFWDF